jgi:cation transport regulator ChaC
VRGCAVASFEAHKGGVVWGVIYEIDDDDLKRLDEREGFDPVNSFAVNRYCRVDVTVQRTAGERVQAVAYVAVPEENAGRPSATYLKHIVEGAAAHSFPDDYIETLRAIAVIEDGEVVSAAIAVDEQSPQEQMPEDDE